MEMLSDGVEYEYVQKGMSLQEAKRFLFSSESRKQEEYIMFAQEKYSNGETSLQYFEEYLYLNALYLLDELEISLSPANQVALAEEINRMARLLQCQFISQRYSYNNIYISKIGRKSIAADLFQRADIGLYQIFDNLIFYINH